MMGHYILLLVFLLMLVHVTWTHMRRVWADRRHDTDTAVGAYLLLVAWMLLIAVGLMSL